MGLYISNIRCFSGKESLDSYVKSVSKRKVNNVFFYYKNIIYLYSNNSVRQLVDCDNLDRQYPVAICQYALESKIDSFELLLTNQQEDNPLYLEDSLSYIYHFVLEHDISVGLLARSEQFIEDNENLLDSFGIIFAEGREISPLGHIHDYMECISISNPMPRPVAKRKPSTRHRVAKSVAPDIDLDESFHEKFLRLSYSSLMDAPEVYNRGGISRQVFSKILSSPDFIPKKETILCLIIGMKLNVKQARELLESAGYTLSRSLVVDSIVSKYIRKEIYDIDLINIELNDKQYPLLGWRPREQ